MIFLFDVDNTLTPSRGIIDPQFATYFAQFCNVHDVYLVTGSDRPKTLEQITPALYNTVKRVYNCCGNEVWEGNTQIRKSEWILPEWPHEWLTQRLIESAYPHRLGKHFEHRTGLCNFSVVGRNAVGEQRDHYYKWDLIHKERQNITDSFNALFGKDIEARIGGETGIDVYPKGSDKSQVLQDFDLSDQLVFIGDRTDPAGNDFSIAQAVLARKGKVFSVNNWKDTHQVLQSYYKAC